jgi:hypothetical protein
MTNENFSLSLSLSLSLQFEFVFFSFLFIFQLKTRKPKVDVEEIKAFAATEKKEVEWVKLFNVADATRTLTMIL